MQRKICTSIALLFLIGGLVSAQTTRKFTLEVDDDVSVAGIQQAPSNVYVPTGRGLELVMNEGHSDFVGNILYTSDGKYVFSCSKGEVRIWRAETGDLIRTFKGIDFPYDDMLPHDSLFPTFSPTGEYFVYYSEYDKTMKICYSLTGEKKDIASFARGRYDNSSYNGHASISADGNYIAVLVNDAIVVYSKTGIEEAYSLQGDASYKSFVFSPDGSYIVAATDSFLDIWDIASRKIVDHIVSTISPRQNSITITKDSNFVIFPSGYPDWTISVYDKRTKRIAHQFDKEVGVSWCLACTSDGKLFSVEHDAMNSQMGELNVFDVFSGKTISSMEFFSGAPQCISFSPSGEEYVLGYASSGEIAAFSTGSKQKIRSFGSTAKSAHELSPNIGDTFCDYLPESDSFFMTKGDREFFIFDTHLQPKYSGNLEEIFGSRENIDFIATKTYPYYANNKGIFGIAEEDGQYSISVYDFNTKSRDVVENLDNIYIVRFAMTNNGDKGVLYFFGDPDKAEPTDFYIFDVDSGDVLYTITSSERKYWQRVAISPNGQFISIDCTDDSTEIYALATGNKVATLTDIKEEGSLSLNLEAGVNRIEYTYNAYAGHDGLASKCTFSKDDRYCVFFKGDGPSIYDTLTWKLVYHPKRTHAAWISNNGNYVALHTFDDTLEIYDWKTDKKLYEYPINENFVDFYFCDKDTKFVTLSYSGILRMYDMSTGDLLASTIADAAGDWLTYTPEGYFTGSEGGINKFVHFVDGMQVFELGQLYDTLYRPDLVQAKLEGKDIGKPDLQEIVATGNAPDVDFTAVPTRSSSRDVQVKFSVLDTGGGIGYVYLSHNGKVMQVSNGEEHKTGRRYVFDCTVTLANGKNEFEAYAANAAGKIESLHATAAIEWRGSTEEANLYVLALGVNEYVRMPQNNLRNSVSDANGIVASFKDAPGGLYKTVNFMQILDADVTKENIQKAFDTFATKVRPDDVFIFYIAGHGENYNGEYYFMPSDIEISSYEELPQAGVSKHFLMESLSKISAQNSVILLDTCFSGSFMNVSQTSEIAQKTAIEHLAHTCGQVIITAASDAQKAAEGYRGHGVFTYVLMEGLSGKANTDKNNRAVSMGELADYVKAEVPNISIKEFRHMQTPWVMFQQSDFSVVSSTRAAPSPAYAISLGDDSYNLSWFTKTIDDSSVNAYLAAVQNGEAALVAASAGAGIPSSNPSPKAPIASASSGSSRAQDAGKNSSPSSVSKNPTSEDSSSSARPEVVTAKSNTLGTGRTSVGQHSRGGPISGIYFDLTFPQGKFYKGTNVGLVYNVGGKHFFTGLDMVASFLDLKDEYAEQSDVTSIFMMETDFLLGVSFNLWVFRPYIAAGGGFYFSTVFGNSAGSAPKGFSAEGIVGLDVTIGRFVIGGVYKLRCLVGSGFIDDFGVSIGWNW